MRAGFRGKSLLACTRSAKSHQKSLSVTGIFIDAYVSLAAITTPHDFPDVSGIPSPATWIASHIRVLSNIHRISKRTHDVRILEYGMNINCSLRDTVPKLPSSQLSKHIRGTFRSSFARPR